jgi:tetratricopeptide (TPR) repeat protein
MVKSLILFLSLLGFKLCFGQGATDACFSKMQQDSLVKRYVDNGALQHSYNSYQWDLYLDSLIAICPQIPDSYREKAIPLIKKGDYGKAFPLEDKAVELDPKKWIAYRAFLKCIFSKDYEGAILDFDEAQKLVPNQFVMDHSYDFFKGISNLELGNFEEAERNMLADNKLQTKGNKNVKAHYNSYLYLGILYLRSQNYQKALVNLSETLNQYEEMTEANYYLAMVYGALGKPKEREKYLKIAQKAATAGFSINEDNAIYVNYPGQVRLYEVEEAMKNNSK